jgi:hypothetical protein
MRSIILKRVLPVLFFFRREALQAIDHRTKVMREVISGMRVVKMYASEDFLQQLIGDIRWYVSISGCDL